MRMKTALVGVTALVLLAGCQRGATTNNATAANTSMPANVAAPAPLPAGNAAGATGNSVRDRK